MRVRRHLHGATRRPPLTHPGNGYGRPGRPGPSPSWNREALAWRGQGGGWDPAELLEPELDELELADPDEPAIDDTALDGPNGIG